LLNFLMLSNGYIFRSHKIQMKKETFITIAICTYNRADYLRDTLRDLANQSADKSQFEILVINNNSTDETESVCEEFLDKHRELKFTFVNETRQGLSYARNRAVSEADSDVILYIDDDVQLKSDFVTSALNHMKKYPDADCAGGRIYVHFDSGEPDWIPDELMPMFGLHDLGNSDRIYPKSNFPRGGNMLIKRDVFESIGRFPTDLGRIGKKLLGSEEKAFFDKAREKGFTLYYWPEMELNHRIGNQRLTEEYLKNQSLGIGLSERLRLEHSMSKIGIKLLSEFVKFGGSLILSIGYVLNGKKKAARFMIQFRIWVLSGFLKVDQKEG